MKYCVVGSMGWNAETIPSSSSPLCATHREIITNTLTNTFCGLTA